MQLAKQKKKAVATSGESFGNALAIKCCVNAIRLKMRVIRWFRPVAPSLPEQKLAHSTISVEVVAATSRTSRDAEYLGCTGVRADSPATFTATS